MSDATVTVIYVIHFFFDYFHISFYNSTCINRTQCTDLSLPFTNSCC